MSSKCVKKKTSWVGVFYQYSSEKHLKQICHFKAIVLAGWVYTNNIYRTNWNKSVPYKILNNKIQQHKLKCECAYAHFLFTSVD